ENLHYSGSGRQSAGEDHAGERRHGVGSRERGDASHGDTNWESRIVEKSSWSAQCDRWRLRRRSEQEIAQAKAELGAEGVGCEPASAASLAGLKKLVRAGFVKANETVVLVLTGHMLKDVDYMLDM